MSSRICEVYKELIFKLLINGTRVYEGSSLVQLIRELFIEAQPNDTIDIYQQARTQWRLVDGGVFPFGLVVKTY